MEHSVVEHSYLVLTSDCALIQCSELRGDEFSESVRSSLASDYGAVGDDFTQKFCWVLLDDVGC